MRVLVLARHAKAEAHTGPLSDHARALALRGRTDAQELGAMLSAAGLEPDVAYVSDAVRTSQTWELASGEWDVPVVHRRRELYNTTVATLVALLNGTEPGATNVMVVGHEPTMSALASFLAGPGSSREALQRVAHGLPTGMAAVLEFDAEWSELGHESARLRAVLGRTE
jgi:phosphohistidine phosphatase